MKIYIPRPYHLESILYGIFGLFCVELPPPQLDGEGTFFDHDEEFFEAFELNPEQSDVGVFSEMMLVLSSTLDYMQKVQ